MFNNTSKIMPYASGQVTGVILPHCDKVLNAEDLDKKIGKAKSHIEHLNGQLPSRHNDGGKAIRANKVTINRQISLASERLTMLQMAKAALPKVQAVAIPEAPAKRQPTMLETATAVASVAARVFRTQAPTRVSYGASPSNQGFQSLDVEYPLEIGVAQPVTQKTAVDHPEVQAPGLSSEENERGKTMLEVTRSFANIASEILGKQAPTRSTYGTSSSDGTVQVFFEVRKNN